MSEKTHGIIMRGDRAFFFFFPNLLVVEVELVIFRKQVAALVTHMLPGRNYREVDDSKSETRSVIFYFATR